MTLIMIDAYCRSNYFFYLLVYYIVHCVITMTFVIIYSKSKSDAIELVALVGVFGGVVLAVIWPVSIFLILMFCLFNLFWEKFKRKVQKPPFSWYD